MPDADAALETTESDEAAVHTPAAESRRGSRRIRCRARVFRPALCREAPQGVSRIPGPRQDSRGPCGCARPRPIHCPCRCNRQAC